MLTFVWVWPQLVRPIFLIILQSQLLPLRELALLLSLLRLLLPLSLLLLRLRLRLLEDEEEPDDRDLLRRRAGGEL